MIGDRPIDDGWPALLQAAARGAAQRGAPRAAPVVGLRRDRADGVEAFVRDRGAGFDLDEVPRGPARRARSRILGRMERHGGTAAASAAPRATGPRCELELPTRGASDASASERPSRPMTARCRRAPPCGWCSSTTTGCSAPASGPSSARRSIEVVGEAPDVDTAVTVDHGDAARRRAARRAPARRRRHGAVLSAAASGRACPVTAVPRPVGLGRGRGRHRRDPAGARGYVTKTITGHELIDAIRRVADGDAVFSPAAGRVRARRVRGATDVPPRSTRSSTGCPRASAR